MQDAIRRSNISNAPRVQREFTNQYKVSGMYADNSMLAQNLRIQQVAKNQQRIERHLVKHRKKETMLKILKVDYGLSTSKLIELNFRDEQTNHSCSVKTCSHKQDLATGCCKDTGRCQNVHDQKALYCSGGVKEIQRLSTYSLLQDKNYSFEIPKSLERHQISGLYHFAKANAGLLVTILRGLTCLEFKRKKARRLTSSKRTCGGKRGKRYFCTGGLRPK